MKSILVLGGTGQIGYELTRVLAPTYRVAAPTRDELDVLSARAIDQKILMLRPSIVINAAGYTAVDAAERDGDACRALNVDAPRALAEASRKIGAWFVHFSTDYVFDGEKRTPYLETDEPRPLSVYGQSKLDGERAIEDVGGNYLIFRTSWVYAPRGKNFPLTMLRLAHERAELAVVNDQHGAPTSAGAIAFGVLQVLAKPVSGVYHMTAAGETTWFEFARRILADDPQRAEQVCREIRPITTAEYPTTARRPAYSVLDDTKLFETFGVRLPAWEEQWSVVARRLSAAATPVRGVEALQSDHLSD